MNRIACFVLIFIVILTRIAFFEPANALAVTNSVVISQLSTGNSSSASNEFVELYNNASYDIDVTNWCLRYTTATNNLQSNPKFCFTPADTVTKMYLSAHSYALIVTPLYPLPANMSPDGQFNGGGMATGGGHVKLLNSTGDIVDVVGWGTATNSENTPAPAPNITQSLVRKYAADMYQDTDNNASDFELKTPLLHGSGITEIRTPVDVCGNIDDIQEVLPSGYGYDEAGNCEPLSNDMCRNIEAIQIVIPAGMQQNADGNCVVVAPDVCDNLDGRQAVVPLGYVRSGTMCVKLEDRELWLSEILPNVSGIDTGREYIELYNPHNEPITLHGYSLQIGKTFEKDFLLPDTLNKIVIGPHDFVTYSDSELGFSLLNTYSGVRLVAPAGNTVSETVYSNPADNEAWAFIDGVWQYTNNVTPAAPNQAQTVVTEADTTTIVSACAAGKYRSPLTNRCRSIEADAAIITDCQDGYYRNPETNRCRKVLTASVTLAPCQAGYSRNPETNRCRKDSTSTSDLAPCKAGQERNPLTNRCRNVTSPLTSAASLTEATNDDTQRSASLLPIAFALAGIGILGYEVFEWRHEIITAGDKLLARFKK